MHEYSIVASLVDRVGAETARHAGARVKRVHVQIGELAGVETGLLATAFEIFRARTVCEEAELVIEAVEARWSCPRCGVAIARGERLVCPACALPARLSDGDEILLSRIEMEVPDVH
jgi:hydrogenase nickel incorporation protein HypA/HybF